MEPDSIQQFIVLVVLLLFSAFFSASETAFTALNRIRLLNMLEEGVKGAETIKRIIDNKNKLLSAILIGNNIVNIAASSLITSMAIKLSGNNNYAIGVATGIMTLLILVFGEITPKTISAQNSEKICLIVAKPIAFFLFIFTPFIYIFSAFTNLILAAFGENIKSNAITESELKTIVNVSHEDGVLEQEEKTMIHNVVDFGGHKAEDIMIPRISITAISVDATYDETLDLFSKEGYSRIPVYEDNMDNIVGILYYKDMLSAFKNKEEFCVQKIMRKPYFSYETQPLTRLFADMRTNRIPICIVLDEYGGTSGLVTLEDLIEEIVGEIDDEYDEDASETEKINENEYIMDGSIKISEANEILGTDLQSDDYDTLGGYVMGVTGNIPEKGETIETDNLRIVVVAVEKNRIEKMHVYILGD